MGEGAYSVGDENDTVDVLISHSRERKDAGYRVIASIVHGSQIVPGKTQ